MIPMLVSLTALVVIGVVGYFLYWKPGRAALSRKYRDAAARDAKRMAGEDRIG